MASKSEPKKKSRKNSESQSCSFDKTDNEMLDKHNVKIIKMSILDHLEDTSSLAISNRIKLWMPQ